VLICRKPPPPLAAHVETIWFSSRVALPHSRERSLPTGRVDIVVPLLQDHIVRFDSVDSPLPQLLRGAVVSGAHDRFAVRGMAGPSVVLGVHLRPGGAAAFFDGGLGALRNRTVPLEDLWGPAACELRERLQAASGVEQRFDIVEQTLRQRLRAAPGPDLAVAQALQSLARDPAAARIECLHRALEMSAARFIRRFEDAVGIGPKRYARVLRFNALLPRIAAGAPPDWAQTAADGGWYDQSHLIHEFKRLAGLTPTAYAPLHAAQPTHVPVVEGGAAVATRKNLQSTRQVAG
jgi:AraC-like DNA-binding protein